MTSPSMDSWTHFIDQSGLVHSVQFSPDATQLVSYGCDSTIRVWDRTLTRKSHQFDRPVCDVAFVPNTRTALSAALDGAVTLWDTVAWRRLRRFEHHEGEVRSIAVSLDGRVAVSGGEDGTLCIWEISDDANMLRLDADSEDLVGVSISQSGSRACSASLGGTLHLWNRNEPNKLSTIHTFIDEAWGAIFSPDERFVFAYGAAEHLVYDIERQRVLDAPFENQSVSSHDIWPPYSHGMPSVTFVSNQRLLVGHNGGLFLWDLDKSVLIRRFEFLPDSTRCVAASLDGQRILSGGSGGTRMWSIDGRELFNRAISAGYTISVEFSPCGTLALMAETNLTQVPSDAPEMEPAIVGTSIYLHSLVGT